MSAVDDFQNREIHNSSIKCLRQTYVTLSYDCLPLMYRYLVEGQTLLIDSKWLTNRQTMMFEK